MSKNPITIDNIPPEKSRELRLIPLTVINIDNDVASSHLVMLQSDRGENIAQYDKETSPDMQSVAQNA